MPDKFYILRIAIQFVLHSVQAVASQAHPMMLLASDLVLYNIIASIWECMYACVCVSTPRLLITSSVI